MMNKNKLSICRYLSSDKMFVENGWVFAFQLLPILIVITKTGYCEGQQFHYETKEFEVPLDHFNFAINNTFKIRYLYNDSYIDKQSGKTPLFFYTGNEGDIETFAKNTGFLWELAKKYRASVVFAEHRYYGKSLPFGNMTFNLTANYGYLSVEQALEDYALLIVALQDKYKYAPVISFGGSYGGMLSAWFRMKYPHLVYGALAASAPIRQFNGMTSCDIFAKITTSVFATTYKNRTCSENVKKSWDLFKQMASTDDGKKKMSSEFLLCDPVKSEADLEKFFDYLEDVYGSLAMVNYPYSNNFLSPLPAYPVRQFCSYLQTPQSGDQLLQSMKEAINVYFNFTGSASCLNYNSAFDTATIGGDAWDIQTCNQMVMPMCNTRDTMFRLKEWNFNKEVERCRSKYHIEPKLNDITIRYGGQNLRDTSNIIFSNGLLDPWSGGGVLQTENDQITIIIIPEGAHHLDLRSSNPKDPASVVQARENESKIIGQWISQFHW